MRSLLTAWRVHLTLIVITVVACGCGDGIEEKLGPPKAQPSVVLASPPRGASFGWGEGIRVTANVRNPPGSVVEFRVGNEIFARDSTPPFETTFVPQIDGQAQVIAQLRDAKGSVIAHDTVTIDIRNPNPVTDTACLTIEDVAISTLGPQPFATLVEPADGATLRPHTPLQLVVEASGLAAGLRRIEIFVNGVIASSKDVANGVPMTTTNFVYEWKDPPPGKYEIVARAVDAEGRSRLSKTARITVAK